MQFIASFLAPIATSLMLAACFNFIMQQTVLDTDYIQKQIKEQHVAEELTKVLPKVLASQGAMEVDPRAMEQALAMVLSPEAIDAKLSEAVSQLDAYLDDDADLPQLDLRDIAAQARANGIEMPEEVTDKPLVLPQDIGDQLKSAHTKSTMAQQYSLIGLIGVLLALFLVAVKTRTYKYLITVFLTSALVQSALFIGLGFGRDMLLGMASDLEPKEFAPLAERLVIQLSGDIGTWFVRFGSVFAVISAVLIAFSAVSHFRHRGDGERSEAADKSA